MNREALDRFCERGLLACFLAILVFGPLAWGAVRNAQFALIEGLTAVVLLLWCVRLWVLEKLRVLWPPICWAVVAFAVYAIGRYATADIEYVARQELIKVLVYAFLFVAAVNNLHRQETMQIIALTLVFLGMSIASYAIYQYLTGSRQVWTMVTPYKHQGTGTYISPNHLGGFLEMLLPLGLAYTLASRLPALPRVFLGYASLVILAGIAATGSRGTWIATLLALCVFFGILLFQRAHRLPALVVVIAIAAPLVVFAPKSNFLRSQVKRLYETGQLDDDGRFDLWRTAVRVWRDNIWWGAGPAHFDYRFRNYRPVGVQLRPDRVHNDYLNTLTDWGIVGTVLVSSAWVLLAIGLAKTWGFVRGPTRDIGERRSSNRFAFVIGASAGLVAILIHSAVDFNMHIPANAILVVVLMALLSSQLRFATERYWFTARLWTKVLASAVMLAGIVFVGSQAFRGGREAAWLGAAQHAPAFSVEQVQALKRAFEIEPRNAQTAYDLGEASRVQSQEGGEHYGDSADGNYEARARQAMEWFGRAMQLDRWDARACVGYGWCLDWLQRPDEARQYYSRAEELDPASYFLAASFGLHYVEQGDFAAARSWFERSLRLKRKENDIARNYLEICDLRLREAATNDFAARLTLPPLR